MSGLIDTIVRRRRASANRRLGPPEDVLDAPPWAAESPAADRAEPAPPEAVDEPAPPAVGELRPESVNGHPPAALNGHAALLPEPEPEADEQPTSTFNAVTPEPDPEPEQPRPKSTPEPDPAPPPEPAAAPEYPSLRERAVLRRRARYLTAVREIQLRDIGGFLVELHRFGRERPDLLQAKVDAAAATDAELRGVHHRMDEEAPIAELRRPGIGGVCEHCGAVHGSLDRFCASCGEPLGR